MTKKKRDFIICVALVLPFILHGIGLTTLFSRVFNEQITKSHFFVGAIFGFIVWLFEVRSIILRIEKKHKLHMYSMLIIRFVLCGIGLMSIVSELFNYKMADYHFVVGGLIGLLIYHLEIKTILLILTSHNHNKIPQ